jgi:hypothetical protein
MVSGDPKPGRREDALISRKIGKVEQVLSWSMNAYIRVATGFVGLFGLGCCRG